MTTAPDEQTNDGGGHTVALEPHEEEEVEHRAPPRPEVVFETIRREGENELGRPFWALVWSALAAGLSMGFSFAGVGLLHQLLPPTPYRTLITSFGYTLGFLIVVLGRQQLFTENTLTVILPLLDSSKKAEVFRKIVRLWIIVLVANVIGTSLFAAACAWSQIFTPEMKSSFDAVAAETTKLGFGEVFQRGIFAGWLIALMVWLLPAAEVMRPVIIIIVTYFVGAFGLTHAIAGSTDVIYAAIRGNITVGHYFAGFLLPVFLGNVAGGVLLVALLNFGQVIRGEGPA